MKFKPAMLVVALAVLAMAAKLYCAVTTYGSVDTMLLANYGKFIAYEGVVKAYLVPALGFNFPPLAGNYFGLAFEWAHGRPHVFDFLLRFPCILADLSVVLLLLWVHRRTGRPPHWGLALLAASPVCFMISGYHGNVDSLIPLGIVLAVVASMQGRAVLAGVMLALACQVKIIPLVASPVLFFYWWHRRQGWKFAAGMAATLLVAWAAPLLVAPKQFIHGVLLYDSMWGWWGITYLLNHSGLPGMSNVLDPDGQTHAQILVTAGLKLLIVAVAIFIAWRRRREDAAGMLATMGLIWVVFFTFAPGFGPQYLAWVGPFLLCYSARWFAAFTAAASVALFVFYNSISNGMPWSKGYSLEPFSRWEPWLLLPWVVFVAITIASWREILGASPKTTETGVESTEVPDLAG